MSTSWQEPLWGQLGAAIDMLERAIVACPDACWRDHTRQPEYWYVAYHTLFFLDYYLAGSPEAYRPPEPFTLDELDPAGLLPDRVYEKDELLRFLAHGRARCRERIRALTDAVTGQRCAFVRLDLSELELMIQNLRHVQHHAAQLNLLLRQHGVEPPRWVSRTAHELD